MSISSTSNKKVNRAIKRKVTKVVAKPIVKHTELSTVVKRSVGRPKKLDEYAIQEIVEALDQFVIDKDDPTLPLFVATNAIAIKYNVFREDLFDYDVYPQFRNSVKRAVNKQEAHLLTMAKTPILAIFRLKQPQHGYKDKVDVEIDQSVSVKHSVDPAMALDFQEYLKRRTIEE